MSEDHAPPPAAGARIVDVVVPVRRDAQAARRCLASVLASPNATPYALIAVIDGAIDREFTAAAGDILRDGRVAPVRSGRSPDYAAAVNAAFALHADRDVVLLQADAEVHGDWLDRLALHAAAATGMIGTFASTAGIATYPRPRESNARPDEAAAAALDRHFAHANRGRSFEAAGVFGPCLYLTRACLSSVGGLNAIGPEDGYASEIDFSLRAASAGHRSVVAGDVFVANDGEGSYGGRSAQWLGHAATPVLAHLHPAYAKSLDEAAARDPARPCAGGVDLRRLAASPRPAIVFVSHAWGGGIRRYMNDLAALVRERADVLYLEPAGGDGVKLHWPREGEGFAAWFRLPGDQPLLAATLRAIGVARLHFHHVHGLPQSILRLPRDSGAPYDCTLHDYAAICPQYHLVDEHGRYCGEPDAAGCAACIARRPVQWDLDIGAWRATVSVDLGGAERVIAPSQDVATRMQRYFPGLAVGVWSHPEAAPGRTRPAIRAVTLGNLSPEKGLHVVAACARDARNRDLPLAFRVLGATTEPIAQSPAAPLTIHGSYEDGELPGLLAAERADVLFFPAQVPETYSYTLSVALATQAPIVASSLGALPERLAGRPRVHILPFDATPAQWNAALLDAAAGDPMARPRATPAPEPTPAQGPSPPDVPLRAAS